MHRASRIRTRGRQPLGVELAASEERSGSEGRLTGRIGTVDEGGDLVGEALLTSPLLGRSVVVGHDGVDLVDR